MAGTGKPAPRYLLFVRNRDGVMRLVTTLGERVPVAWWHAVNYSTLGCGVIITPVGAKGVTIFEDEFIRVEEFPVWEGCSGVASETLVEHTKEPSLVA